MLCSGIVRDMPTERELEDGDFADAFGNTSTIVIDGVAYTCTPVQEGAPRDEELEQLLRDSARARKSRGASRFKRAVENFVPSEGFVTPGTEQFVEREQMLAKLKNKLERLETLAERGATPGERDAAARGAERVRLRIEEL